jgi:membrane protein implicated in regulation of membrane protease activity
MEWFTYIMWLGVAIVFGLIEVITINFYTIWLAISAILTAVVSLFILSPLWQIIIFSIISLILVILSEKLLRKMIFSGKEHVAMNAEAMSGKEGVVVSRIRNDRGEGVVKISGVSWSARSIDGEDIAQNLRVKVHRIEGVKLIVSASSKENGDNSMFTDMIKKITNARIIETQSFKKIFDSEIHSVKIFFDGNNIDRTDIEIFESSEVICDYDIGLKENSEGREFELSTKTNSGELVINPIDPYITDSTHYSIALRLGIPSTTRLKISATVGDIVVKDNWKADIDVNDLGDLDIETANVAGDVRIRSTSGDVKTGVVHSIDLKSSAGDTQITGCNMARIKTSSGDVEIGRIEEGTIQVSSGDLDIGKLDGSLTIISSSGDISIDDCICKNSLSITAKSGDLQINRFYSESTQNIVHTSSGDIVIGIDKNSSLVGKCDSVSGDISIIGAKHENKITDHKKEFTISEGTGKLVISSISGDVDIKIH